MAYELVTTAYTCLSETHTGKTEHHRIEEMAE